MFTISVPNDMLRKYSVIMISRKLRVKKTIENVNDFIQKVLTTYIGMKEPPIIKKEFTTG